MQRSDAKVHQHYRWGERERKEWSMLLPFLNSTSSQFSYKVILHQPKNSLFLFPTQVSEFSLLGKPPIEKRERNRVAEHWKRFRTEVVESLWHLKIFKGEGSEQPSFKAGPALRRRLDQVTSRASYQCNHSYDTRKFRAALSQQKDTISSKVG